MKKFIKYLKVAVDRHINSEFDCYMTNENA